MTKGTTVTKHQERLQKLEQAAVNWAKAEAMEARASRSMCNAAARGEEKSAVLALLAAAREMIK